MAGVEVAAAEAFSDGAEAEKRSVEQRSAMEISFMGLVAKVSKVAQTRSQKIRHRLLNEVFLHIFA
jgi:hypothetical protein